ncbi:hypothetical protein KOW79_000281 [Hemibagrus wyckioides]|uniref:Uncharacterized protein n=1 Tax=Hemibagrus wyckioides TaxID=337641 RepID=A0A9D3P6H9_9TELE|nr:hypothetical protein KOW79_000281 [Hemibagrus wyckioides]
MPRKRNTRRRESTRGRILNGCALPADAALQHFGSISLAAQRQLLRFQLFPSDHSILAPKHHGSKQVVSKTRGGLRCQFRFRFQLPDPCRSGAEE